VSARKYIFNAGILGAAFSFLGLARTTKRGPRDWRLILMWISALVGLAIAVGTVIEDSRDAEDY
jgi:cytochrome c oxidase assembly factor CtaG